MSAMNRTAEPAIEVQFACEHAGLPDEASIRSWALAAHRAAGGATGEITVRTVDEDTMREMNRQYRGKDNSTNVLSFPFEMPAGLPADAVAPVLGDIAICAEVVAREAAEQKKDVQAHWAHMVVHGVLHLLGHDHQNDSDAEVMEALERDILTETGFADPYRETQIS
jgi:probable rRNA maturation factor